MKIFSKKISNMVTVAFLLLLLVGCSDFLDVNENPNNPTISTPKITLPVAQQSFVSLNATSMNYLGNFMVANWAVPSNWSAMENLIRYKITADFYSDIFDNSYSSIFKNLTYIDTYDDGVVDYSAYKVIAAALKGFQYQRLVDLYGDIPYSEANLRAENLTPKYDDAATVYKEVIDKLTEYGQLAAKMPDVYENPGSQDIIFHGDMAKWAKFINTVKLRMLIRLSATGQDAYIKGEIAKIDANGAGYIDADVFANPGYSNDANKQSPFFGYIGKQLNGSPTDRNDYTVACKYAIDNMILNNDLRYKRLYAEAPKGGYHGAEQTTTLPSSGFTNKDLSHVGPGLLDKSEQDQIVFLLAESLFLQAEAVQRGYIAGGEAVAKDLYHLGIKASYAFLKVENAVTAAETYYAQAIDNISWDQSPNKIEAIIVQKNLALNGVAGIESWIELTRTGFPSNAPVPKEVAGGKRPLRLLYPSSEIARNSKNVPSQTNKDAFTAPFWKK